ncbi:MAG: putative toxin-antitoxin system toxin component, PIN family [Pyrinomonadaceae bacterium]
MEKLRIVFDCMIFLQAVISDKNVAFELFEHLEKDVFTLFVSGETLDEVNNVLNRPYIRNRNPQITDESIEMFLSRVLNRAKRLNKIPKHFQYPRDPKDEKYINPAIEAEANYIVSRDNDLLDLMTGIDAESKEFRQRFRFLKVIAPGEFLRIIQEGI